MSIRWGYVCRSHTPHIISDTWFNLDAGRDALRQVAKQVRVGLWPNVEGTEEPMQFYYEWGYHTAPVYWLLQHPHCDVALRNEYGETEELHPGTEPPGRCGVPPTTNPNEG